MQMICLAGILEKIAFEMPDIEVEKVVRTSKKRQLEDDKEEGSWAIRRIAMEGMTTQTRAFTLVTGRVLEDLLTPLVRRHNNWSEKKKIEVSEEISREEL